MILLNALRKVIFRMSISMECLLFCLVIDICDFFFLISQTIRIVGVQFSKEKQITCIIGTHIFKTSSLENYLILM